MGTVPQKDAQPIPQSNPLAGTEAPALRARTLTDLQRELESWTKELRNHTGARNYLYQAFEGAVQLPMMTLSGPGVEAGINMRALPEEYANAIIQVLLEHEEQNALNAWSQVYEIAHEARILIKRMQQDQGNDNAPANQGFSEPELTPEEQEQDNREEKLNAIARDMLAEVAARGEAEPNQ